MVLTQLYCSGDKLINTSNDWKGEVDKTFQKTRVKEFDTVGYIKKAAYFYKILKSEGKEEDNAIFQEVFVPRFYRPTSE